MPEGLRIYNSFEVEFQLDGHYWLQYGQYLVEMGTFEPALGVLNKSIQAYSTNPYAVHAYADVQLRVALERQHYDATTVELIGDAVKSLEQLHSTVGLKFDQYPIVTLSERHIRALIKHRQLEQAKTFAAKYFKQLDEIGGRGLSDSVQKARTRLLHFVTSGDWVEGVRKSGRGGKGGRRRDDHRR